jgi:hypothetical protein
VPTLPAVASRRMPFEEEEEEEQLDTGGAREAGRGRTMRATCDGCRSLLPSRAAPTSAPTSAPSAPTPDLTTAVTATASGGGGGGNGARVSAAL